MFPKRKFSKLKIIYYFIQNKIKFFFENCITFTVLYIKNIKTKIYDKILFLVDISPNIIVPKENFPVYYSLPTKMSYLYMDVEIVDRNTY